MTLQVLLDERGISMYRLAKMSGVSKTVIIDICSGKSAIENCTVKTVYSIAKALGCTVEELLMNHINFERVVQAAQNGEYEAKNCYYHDIIKPVSQNVILALESAAEFHGMTTGNFLMDVHVYTLCALPAPFVVHSLGSFEDIDFVEINGVKVATLNQTVNDLLASDNVDLQIILETLGMYYYKNGESFSGLDIDDNNLQRFHEVKQWAIEYWDD